MTIPAKPKRGRPPGRPSFERVERAREALQKHAETAAKLVVDAAKVAAKKGNHAPAAWVLEHVSAVNAEGKEIRPIASGIDRQQIEKGGGIQILLGSAYSQPPIATREVSELPQLPETAHPGIIDVLASDDET